ncbi:MAG: glycoside hydrolase family 97 protein [Gemmatimonadaceae bacterium]|nr:glycoside hydrolase family 97 protein [Gemmatimonadaceae bacterium]
MHFLHHIAEHRRSAMCVAVVMQLVSVELTQAQASRAVTTKTKSQVVSVTTRSPDRAIVLTLDIAARGVDDGHLTMSIRARGSTIVAASSLGLDLDEGGPLGAGLRLQTVRRRTHDGVVTGLIGKTSRARDHYNETVVAFEEVSGRHRRLDVIVRAFNDGVAFRYRIPEQRGLTAVTITQERTRLVLDPQSDSYVLPRVNYTTSYEGYYTVGPIGVLPADTLLALPILVHPPRGPWVAVTEADLTNYAGLYLTPLRGAAGTLESRLAPWSSDTRVKVRTALPMTTPWRLFMIADAPARMIESNLVTLLNPPSVIADPSWIHPGKTTFPWWNDYVMPDTTFRSGLNTETAKYYIDFCAEHGIAYHTLDGFEDLAWYGGRIDPGDSIPDVTRARPGLDLPEVLRYAKSKGVKIRAWMHWRALRPQLDTALARYERMGIEGIMVDFMDHDDQDMVGFYHDVLAKAAAHHLTVIFHGAYKPTGLSRTYPNLMTVEAVLGLEYDKFSDSRGVTPSHELIVPFVRMLAGPLDFHQGGFRYATSADFRTTYTGPRVIGTRARTLATYIVYEDYMPMMADAPSSYRGQTGLDFLAGIPTAWDETRILTGDIGHVITAARRRGRTWYVGSMTDSSARRVAIPLRFLGSGRFNAEIFADSLGASPTSPASLASVLASPHHECRVATARDTIHARLREAGGHAIRFTPEGVAARPC